MNRTIVYFVVLLLLQACTTNNDQSDAYGNFEANDIIVSAESNGKLLIFDLSEGDQLKQGEWVGLTDTSKFDLQRQQLLAQKAAVSTKLSGISSQVDVYSQQKKNLKVDLKRVKNLFDSGAATQKQLDDLQGQLDLIEEQIKSVNTQYATVNSELKVIDAQVDQVNQSVKDCYIYNPISGTVLEKYADQFEVTAFGKPLYKVASLDEMILRVYMSGELLANLKVGQKVSVRVDKNADENRSLEGEVSWISSEAEFTPKIIQTKEERVKLVYAVKITVKNDGKLKIGMPGEVKL